MPPVVVVARLDGEGLLFGAAGDGERVRLPLLLARDGRKPQTAEPELALDAEQALPAADERRRRLQEHVAGLDRLHDLVLVAGVLDLQLVLEVELVARVAVHVDPQLVADRADDAEAEVLLERRVDLSAAADGLLLLVAAVLEARVHVGLPAHAKGDFVLAEDGREGALPPAGHDDGDAEAARRALALPGALRERLPKTPLARFRKPQLAVRIEADDDGQADVELADALAHGVAVARRVERRGEAPAGDRPEERRLPPRRRIRPPGARMDVRPDAVERVGGGGAVGGRRVDARDGRAGPGGRARDGDRVGVGGGDRAGPGERHVGARRAEGEAGRDRGEAACERERGEEAEPREWRRGAGTRRGLTHGRRGGLGGAGGGGRERQGRLRHGYGSSRHENAGYGSFVRPGDGR